MARPKAVLESLPAPDSNGEKRARRKRAATTRQVYERRYVQTVHSVDLWSVLKVTICFYLSALIVMAPPVEARKLVIPVLEIAIVLPTVNAPVAEVLPKMKFVAVTLFSAA